MKCAKCLSEISRGLEERKRVEYRRLPGQDVKVFGIGMPDGPLDRAAGQLVAVKHSKCYWADENKRRRAAEAEEHVAGTLAAKQDERAADPGHQPRREQDWRDPETLEIEDLL